MDKDSVIDCYDSVKYNFNMIFSIDGWVKYRKVPYKDGIVDVWVGDCADNPNNKEKSKISLNGSVTYIRFENENWGKIYKNISFSNYINYTKHELKNITHFQDNSAN